MKRTISISQYNALFHIAENILQQSWRDLGLSDQEIIDRSNKNKELQRDFVDFWESEFDFYVLEFCSPEELEEKRWFWINFWKKETGEESLYYVGTRHGEDVRQKRN